MDKSKLLSYVLYGANLPINAVGGALGLAGRVAEDIGLIDDRNKYMNVGRAGLAVLFGLAVASGVSELSNPNLTLMDVLETAGQATLCWRYLADAGYLRNPKQIGRDIKSLF